MPLTEGEIADLQFTVIRAPRMPTVVMPPFEDFDFDKFMETYEF